MRIGLNLPAAHPQSTPTLLRDLARRAEDLGLAELVLWAITRRAPWRHERGWLAGLGTPVLTLAISALGILYYVVLGKADLSWKLAQQASKHELTMWPILLAVAPLVIPARVAWRPREPTMMAIINRVWVPAAIGISVLSTTGAGATPLHAFQGIALPLGVLAVEGVVRIHDRGLGLSRRTGYALGGLMSRLGVDNRFQLGLALGAMRAASPAPRPRTAAGG